MNILEKIYWKTNLNARDITDLFGPVLTAAGFSKELLSIGLERHIIYRDGSREFDFWWKKGNRPVLFFKQNGEQVKTNIYQNLIDKNASHIKPIGAQIFFIDSKLDKDIYLNEHLRFVSEVVAGR